MAGDWIKLEITTLDKPEVIRMARILNCDRDLVLGKLVRLWGWFDRNSVDGVVDGVVSTDVDALVDMTGFTSAAQSVGWVEFDDELERVSLPNFGDHNGETAKKRALKNKRQSKWRDKSVDAPPSTDASTREEKRRDNKKVNKKNSLITLKTFIDQCEKLGVDTIPSDSAVFEYCKKIEVPYEWVELAWIAFKENFLENKKKQANWRSTFVTYVKNGYLKVWWIDPKTNEPTLTSRGRELEKYRNAK